MSLYLIWWIPAMIDEIDAKILRILQQDGRMPWVELGEQVNLSSSACQRRVQAMIEKGVIDGIGAQTNPAALGFEIEAFVSVHVERQDVARAEKFRNVVRQYPEVQTCHMLSGEVDYLLRVVARDLKSYGRFVEEKILAIPGVKDASSSIVLDRVKTSSLSLP